MAIARPPLTQGPRLKAVLTRWSAVESCDFTLKSLSVLHSFWVPLAVPDVLEMRWRLQIIRTLVLFLQERQH